jgi:endonuclease/exonuclease/phosphatase family metal-dependent hydrolase
MPKMTFRIVTYNIHKCRGLDGRVDPTRIVEVLREINADIIALQEVLSVPGHPKNDQSRFITQNLGFHSGFGPNRGLKGGVYGNLLLSRFPFEAKINYDVSICGYEQRGCLHGDIAVSDTSVHVFNVHLGTSFFERRHQAKKLVSTDILQNEGLHGSRIVLGDFNEWTKGCVSTLLSNRFRSVDIRKHIGRSRTYPGLIPFLHLDHVYVDPDIAVRGLTLHNTRKSVIASDHLPLVADLELEANVGTWADSVGLERALSANSSQSGVSADRVRA